MKAPSLAILVGLAAGGAWAVDLKKGQALYEAKCSQCHGEQGDGKGVGAERFRPLPRDFTTGIFKIRTTQSGDLPTRQDLIHIIRRGMPYTGMPAWPHFSDEEVESIAAYVETFSADFADTSMRPKTVEIPRAPAFKPEHVAEGRKIFEANKCFDCHGQKGRGDGESAPTLSDDWGAPIRPANLTKPWAFRGGSNREDIYRAITTGLNGTPMPSFANDITPEDRWKVVDYVQSLAHTEYGRMQAASDRTQPMHQAPYGLTVVAKAVDTLADERLDTLFAAAQAVLFPVIGQVVEDPRCFNPGVNAIAAQALYDSSTLVLRLSWHDMTPETQGMNLPLPGVLDTAMPLSDAVAVQFPAKMPEGKAKPYFLRGDAQQPVDLWFADLAHPGGKPVPITDWKTAQSFVTKGSGQFKAGEGTVKFTARYREGEWQVTLRRSRHQEKGLGFESEQFIPMAFSVWDGSLKETGRRHGMTAWYSLYLQKPTTEKPWVPAAKAGAWALGLQALALLGIRRWLKSK